MTAIHQRGKNKRLRIPVNVLLAGCVGCAILLSVWHPYKVYNGSFHAEPPPTSHRFQPLPPKTGRQNQKKKNNNNNNNNNNNKVPSVAKAHRTVPKSNSNSNSIGFVHIGKTGGSSISVLLRNGCPFFVNKPCHEVPNETVISKRVETYYHVADFSKLPDSKLPTFLMSVRDVYDRTVSALLYHHPGNKQHYGQDLTESTNQREGGIYAYKCFPTLEVFASFLTRGNSTDCDYPYHHSVIVNSDCSALACAAIQGRVRLFIHLFFNYRNIGGRIRMLEPLREPNRKLYVIRKEHLWEDWRAVNRLFGDNSVDGPSSGEGAAAWRAERNITGLVLPVTRDITDEGRARLCKALEVEYAAYFQLLKIAENMEAGDIEDAKTLASKNCPVLDFRSM